METNITFTTTPPTTPGFYAWRSCKGDDRNFSGTVWKGADGELWASVELRVGLVSEIGGEWCRLVPAEEVLFLQKRNDKLTAAIRKFVHRCEIGEMYNRR